MSVNKVILVGRLGQNPEIRNTPSGATVANFSVATSETWNDKAGEKQEKTEWHRIVVWGKLAELCGQYLQKGRQVYVEGRLQTRQWQDKDNQTKYTTEVMAQTVQFLGAGTSAGAGASPVAGATSYGNNASYGSGASSGAGYGNGNAAASQNQYNAASPFGGPSEPSFTEDDLPF